MPSSREYSWPIQEQYKNKNYVFTWQRNKGNLDKSLLWFRDGVIESNGSWVLVSYVYEQQVLKIWGVKVCNNFYLCKWQAHTGVSYLMM